MTSFICQNRIIEVKKYETMFSVKHW